MQLKIQKIHPSAKVPTYANPGDAGMDLHAIESVSIKPGRMALVATGIAVQLPKSTVGLIWDKSGLATNYGLKVLGGVIDEGYRGEIKVGLINLGAETYHVEAGNKVAQMLIQAVHRPKIQTAVTLTTSKRGAKGFGSSGK
jgi:dUTP pyrophosphatase